MRHEKNGAKFTVFYDSQAEFIGLASQPIQPGKKSETDSHNRAELERDLQCLEQKRQGNVWYGIDPAALVSTVAEGWREGSERILAELAELAGIDAPISQKRRRIRADFGDSIDMQSVYQGRLDTAWQRCAKRATRAPRPVRLVASMQGRGTVRPEVFYARGAALLKTADLLNEAGYAVEIVADYTVESPFMKSRDSTTLTHRIPLKEAGQPLDLPRLAAAVALSGFKRHYGFIASIHAAQHFGRYVSESRGSSVWSKKIDDLDIVGFEYAIDMKSAREAVKRALEEIEQSNQQPD